jgi:hypothetical protein
VKTAIGAARAEKASVRSRKRQSSKGAEMPARKSSSHKPASRKAAKKKSATQAPAKKRATRKTASSKTGRKAASRTTSTSKAIASKKVKKVMHERKEGTLRSGKSGKKVTSRKQAIAIGLSEARKAGAKVPKKRS